MALFETSQHFGLSFSEVCHGGSITLQETDTDTETETGETATETDTGNENGDDASPSIDVIQDYDTEEEQGWRRPTFKDCVAADIGLAFFNEDEHADMHNVDGKDVLVVIIEEDLREHSAHWEAGAKQNFDTGLYDGHIILYIRCKDYGPKPKIGKRLVLDANTDHKRTYEITLCREEAGVYRMTLKRVRQ